MYFSMLIIFMINNNKIKMQHDLQILRIGNSQFFEILFPGIIAFELLYQ